jgi:hypothetical protein|tara:strand:+ start:202 stop:480 length:279 start_codon:yes stop_codon:yes gene_type:complete
MKCPYCKSTNLEYLPDVDGHSFVSHTYVQKNGEWKIKVTMDKIKNQGLGYDKNEAVERVDASTITTGDIYDNDSMSFMSCLGCTAEFHGNEA